MLNVSAHKTPAYAPGQPNSIVDSVDSYSLIEYHHIMTVCLTILVERVPANTGCFLASYSSQSESKNSDNDLHNDLIKKYPFNFILLVNIHLIFGCIL